MPNNPPTWITPAGSLGVIPEGRYFQLPLQAEDPLGDNLQFRVISGSLPAGIICNQDGVIVGIPQAVARVAGVPEEVSRDVTSKFAARVYTTRVINGRVVVDRLADRTFTLTVSGQDAPEFLTPAGAIGQYADGSLVTGLQVQYTDTDPDDRVRVKLIAGNLPPGLSITDRGLISGYILPLPNPSASPGFGRVGQGFDTLGFDFPSPGTTVNQTFEFVLEVTDGKASDVRAYNITVWSANGLTADNTFITADNTFITADASPRRPPIILNPQGSIGTIRSDNFFAYQFNGLDPDGNEFEFDIYYDVDDSSGIPGVKLDQRTGWLYGYIPDLGNNQRTFNFTIRIFKEFDITLGNDYQYSLTVTGAINTDTVWITGSDLGVIDNGAVSDLAIRAQNVSNIPLIYSLVPGSNSRLPQGLTLLPSGELAGRVSFNTFAFDGGATTFDVVFNDRGEISSETTFDLVNRFTAQATNLGGTISIQREFRVRVNRVYNEPYENLYIQAMPPENDRALISELLQNSDIFVPSLLYRPDDPNFGRVNKLVYVHAYGLRSSLLEEYVAALDINHYLKQLTLGEIRVAQARRNGTGEILYEVVYSQVIDDLVNQQGQSVSKEVLLPFPVELDDSTEVSTVYPNSLINMRDQMIDSIGQVSTVLPTWMLSQQANGKILGFTPAVVLAYAKPNCGDQIAYYINTKFGDRLNQVDFQVDRYELDRSLTANWDPATQSWVPPGSATTFDLEAHYLTPSMVVGSGGTGYAVNDRIRILGSQVGGVDGVNDIDIRVNQVAAGGVISGVFYTGTAPITLVGNTYAGLVGTNIVGTGTGAEWTFVVSAADPTVFDGGGTNFIQPSDLYPTTDTNDKYLVFPRRNILG